MRRRGSYCGVIVSWLLLLLLLLFVVCVIVLFNACVLSIGVPTLEEFAKGVCFRAVLRG